MSSLLETSLVKLSCAWLVALTASCGDGCGVAGAYLTDAAGVVVRTATGEVAPSAPAFSMRGKRAFAQVVPLAKTQEFLVLGGYTAARDGDVADYALTVERCQVAGVCEVVAMLEEPILAGDTSNPLIQSAQLPDGTVVTKDLMLVTDANSAAGFQIRPIPHPAWGNAVFQAGDAAVIANQARLDMIRSATDYTSLPVSASYSAVWAGFVNATTLLFFDPRPFAVDITTGATTPFSAPEFSVAQAFAYGTNEVMVLGHNAEVARFDGQSWKNIPELQGVAWQVHAAGQGSVVLSMANPTAHPSGASGNHATARSYYIWSATHGLQAMATPAYPVGASWLILPPAAGSSMPPALLHVGGAKAEFDNADALAAA